MSYQPLGDHGDGLDPEKDAAIVSQIDVGNYEGRQYAASKRTFKRRWQPDVNARFPWLGVGAMILYIILCGILIFILLYSRDKDYDTFCLIDIRWLHGKRLRFNIPVSVWISSFMFFMGKLLALAFLEAVTVYWWVAALKGKSLRSLNHDYEASKSVSTIARNLRLFSWLCLCSIVFTIFGISGPILQKSSTYAADRQAWFVAGPVERGSQDDVRQKVPSLMATFMTTFSPNASAVTDDQGNFLTYMPPVRFVKESFARNSDLIMEVEGCRHTDGFRTVSECAGWFETVGFEFECAEEEFQYNTTTRAFNEVFGVSFHYDSERPWIIQMTIRFKVTGTCGSDAVIISRKCSMKPSLVVVPVLFRMLDELKFEDEAAFFETQNTNGNIDGDATFEKGNNARATLLGIDLQDSSRGIITADGKAASFAASEKVSNGGTVKQGYSLSVKGARYNDPNAIDIFGAPPVSDSNHYTPSIPINPYYVDLPANRTLSIDGDPARTLLGIAKLFNDTISSSVVVREGDADGSVNQTLVSTGGMMYVLGNRFIKEGENEGSEAPPENTVEAFELCSMFFDDPTQLVLDYVRELTFRYAAMLPQKKPSAFSQAVISVSVAPPLNNSNYYALTRSKNSNDYGKDLLDRYSSTRSTYKTDGKLVAAGIAIMITCCISTCTLFWGFWKLGRQVTLSPLEMGWALALYTGPGSEKLAVAPGEASNVKVNELMDALGDVKVRYGEIAPGRLGLGLYEDVDQPRVGKLYK